MFEKYVGIILIGILYYSFLEYKKNILVKKIIIHMVVISAIQILWTVAQLLPIYLYDTFISNICWQTVTHRLFYSVQVRKGM